MAKNRWQEIAEKRKANCGEAFIRDYYGECVAYTGTLSPGNWNDFIRKISHLTREECEELYNWGGHPRDGKLEESYRKPGHDPQSPWSHGSGIKFSIRSGKFRFWSQYYISEGRDGVIRANGQRHQPVSWFQVCASGERDYPI